jgi:hypothetical protein
MRNPDAEVACSPEAKKEDLWTEKEVRRLLKELDESGEQVAPFARRRGFKAQRLHWWMSKLGWKRSKPLQPSSPLQLAQPRFVPVRVVPDSKPTAGAPRGRGPGVVVELGSRHIRVEADFDAQVLRRVVQVLEEVPRC